MKIEEFGVFQNSKAKAIIALFLLVGAFFVFWATNKTQAGNISGIAVSTSSVTPDATGVVYTITLTPASAIPADGSIHIQFRYREGHVTLTSGNPSKESGTSASINNLVWAGNNEFYATVTGEVAGGTALTIKAGGLQNPAQAGKYSAVVWTAGNSGATIDGSQLSNSTSRDYYTIGTPVVIGRVTDPDDEAVSGAWINVHTTGNNPQWGGGSTDELGYYSVGTVADSTPASGTDLKINAFAPNQNAELGQTNEEQITFNGLTITKNIQFTASTKTVTGRVMDDDGEVIVGARINLWKVDGMGWAQTTTDSNGNYEVQVKGGRWDVMPQADNDDDWAYGQPPTSAIFSNNDSIESQTVNFTVMSASSTLTGSIRLPNGSVPDNPQNFWVNAHAMMMGAGTQLGNDGNFTLNLPAGTYMLEIFDQGQNYAVPEMAPVTVGEDETKNVGTVTLINRDATIQGRATDQDGNPVPNQKLNAFMMKKGTGGGGGGWAEAQTDSTGNFSMKVFSGRWMVHVPNWGNNGDTSQYVLDGNPTEVKVESGQTATVNISLVETSATISGNIVDPEGNVISEMYGWVFANQAGDEAFFGPGLGDAVNFGQFSFNVPPGTYEIGLGPMPGSGYSAGDTAEVTVVDGETATQNITVYPSDMTISGTIQDENGNPVTGIFMEIFATNNTGGWQNAMINQSNGTYEITVASAVDPWNIGYFVDPSSGYYSEKLTDSSISGDSGETITKNITVRTANATISGQVTDNNGSPMSDVFVFADNRTTGYDRQEAEFMGPMFMGNNMTDANGNFSVNVPAGTYNVGASLPRSVRSDLINPERVQVTVAANGTAIANLAFKIADIEVIGTVNLDGSSQEGAYVWAWSEEGGYAEVQADDNGNYALNVTADDTWHIGTNSDVVDSTNYVRSEEYIIDTSTADSFNQDIDLETVADGLADPVTTSFDPANAKVTNLSDGSQITIPANAMGDADTVTLNATTTSELPRTTNSKPIGTGLELTVMEDNGTSITSFDSDVSITLPYDETILDDLKITEDDLVAAYWDETNGVWQPLDNYTIDKENNLIVMSTSHFTTFGIVGDTNGDGIVNEDDDGTRADIDSWKAERYFKELAGKVRERLKLVVKGDHFEDNAEVKIGSKEAYSVKVMKHGERIVARFKMGELRDVNAVKRTVKITNPGAESRVAKKKINLKKVPLRIESNIFNTATTEGIKNVQTLLFNKGFLEEKYITGIFGHLTQNALINFQKANGIPGTGTIGPLTQAKMIELKSNFYPSATRIITNNKAP